MRSSLSTLGCLLGLLMSACASRDPFYVEQPLSRTTPLANEARLPAVHVAQPRPLRIAEQALPSGMLARVVERPHSGLVSLIYVSREARMGADYLPVFVGDALLAGASRQDRQVIHPLTVAGEEPLVLTSTSGTTISLTCGAASLDEALELLAAMVQRPVFEPTWMAPVRSRTRLDLLHLRQVYWSWWLASEHRGLSFGLNVEKIAETVRDLDQQALGRAHGQLFRPDTSALVVVGDVAAPRALAAFADKFSGWLAAPREPAPAPAARAAAAAQPVERQGRKIMVFDEPGYPHVTVLQNAPPLESKDAVAYELLYGILAGVSSNLVKTLRFQQGHAYSVGARTVTVPGSGRFLFVNTAVAAETLPQDVAEILRALERLRTTRVDAETLAGAKAQYAGKVASALSSGSGIARYLASVYLRDAPALEDIQARLGATTAEDLQRVATAYLDPERATIAVMGGASGAVEALRGLGEVSIK